MSATSSIHVFHGSGPTDSTWTTNGRYHKGDTDPTTDGATSAVQVPISSTTNSWRKSHKLKFDTSPTGSASNMRAYDGVALPTGIKLFGKTDSSYTQASVTDETLAMTGFTDMVSYTSGSPLTINAGSVITNPTTGYGSQDYLVTIVQIGSTATAQTITGHAVTYIWAET